MTVVRERVTVGVKPTWLCGAGRGGAILVNTGPVDVLVDTHDEFEKDEALIVAAGATITIPSTDAGGQLFAATAEGESALEYLFLR
jgi:hypothetical protein